MRRMLNLELLSYNSTKSLNLQASLCLPGEAVQHPRMRGKRDTLTGSSTVATEISRKQMLVLESAGAKVDRMIDLGDLKDNPGGLTIERPK